MPSSYTSNARFTLQATGENNNTWGAILNSGVFQLVDDAINGRLGLAVSGPHTLTTVNGATDEARMHFIDVTGGTGGTLTMPAAPGAHFVRNGAAGGVTLSAGGAVKSVFGPNDAGPCFSDGSNVYPIMIAGLSIRSYVDGAITGTGQLPSPAGNLGKALVVQDQGLGPQWIPGLIGAQQMSPGAALGNLGYTPANRAGDTFTGNIAAPMIFFGNDLAGALNGDSNSTNLFFDAPANLYLQGSRSTHAFSFCIGATLNFNIDANGNVAARGGVSGISLNTGANYSLNGDANFSNINFNAGGCYLQYEKATGNLNYVVNNISRFVIDGAGNVSAGGNVTVAGNVTVGGTLVGANVVTTASIANGAVTAPKLAGGAAVSNIGYTPVNRAGDTITGNLTVQGQGWTSGSTILTSSPTGGGLNFNVDGILRWNISVPANGTGDLNINYFNAAGAFISTLINFNLGSGAIIVGANSQTYFNRSQGGTLFTASGAVSLLGTGPNLRFNSGSVAGNVVAFGQLDTVSGPTGRVMAFTKGDGSSPQIYFDVTTGIGYAANWTSTSDRRLKFDIKALAKGLDALAALTPFTYGMAGSEADAKNKLGFRSAGIMAQDLIGTPMERLVHEAPLADAPYLTLDTAGLTAWYIAAFREIRDRLAAIEGRLAAGGL